MIGGDAHHKCFLRFQGRECPFARNERAFAPADISLQSIALRAAPKRSLSETLIVFLLGWIPDHVRDDGSAIFRRAQSDRLFCLNLQLTLISKIIPGLQSRDERNSAFAA